MDEQPLRLSINGVITNRAVNPGATLLEVLRDDLCLTGTKRGCDVGDCGCCSVLLDGKPILSCLLPAAEAEGAEIITIEGIASGVVLHQVQESMVQLGAIQCGFCTPAMVINAFHLLNEKPDPTRDEIKECVSGTLCRCTGYTKIEKAVAAASQRIQG